jgi:hypothetical protein
MCLLTRLKVLPRLVREAFLSSQTSLESVVPDDGLLYSKTLVDDGVSGENGGNSIV